MTVLKQSVTYYQLETPLNEHQQQPYLRIEKHEIPNDPIQQRMLFILLFVVAFVVVFAVFVAPKWSTGEPVINPLPESAVADTNTSETAGTAGITGRLSPIFSPEVKYWETQLVAWADNHNLDPNMAATIMQIESCGDPQAISGAGAQGLFQVMPYHFVSGEDSLDPHTNARRGLGYYAEQLQHFEDIYLAFAAYNGGPRTAVLNWEQWPHETQRYFYWSQGIYQDTQNGATTSPRLEEWMAAGGASLCQQAANRLGLPK